MSTRSPDQSLKVLKTDSPASIVQRRRDRLRHIRPTTHEQQVALVEEARAARRAAQDHSERE
jgi:hypothetical protein